MNLTILTDETTPELVCFTIPVADLDDAFHTMMEASDRTNVVAAVVDGTLVTGVQTGDTVNYFLGMEWFGSVEVANLD